MQRSRYTLFIDDFPRKGAHLLFSTRTHAQVVVDDELRRVVERLPNIAMTDQCAESMRTLWKMGFLVEDEDEDTRNIEARFRRVRTDTSQLRATVLTTYACNFACPYCVESQVRSSLRMDDETARVAAAYTCTMASVQSSRSVFLTFYGGEPLLNLPALRTVAGEVRRFCRARKLDFAFGMTTNGALLTEEVTVELTELGLRGVKVTIDGSREYHDARRPFASGRGSFDTIVENIRRACEHVEVDVGGNFDEENVASFSELLDHLRSLGLDRRLHAVRFKPISSTLADRAVVGPGAEVRCVYGDPRTARHMVELRNLALNKGFRTDPGVGVNVCTMVASPSQFTVDPAGKLYKCPALVGHEEFAVGTVMEGEKRQPADDGVWRRCLSCEYLPLCGEGCIYGALVRFGDPGRLNCLKDYVQYVVTENLKADYSRGNRS